MKKEAAVIGIKKHKAMIDGYEKEVFRLKQLVSDLGVELCEYSKLNKTLQDDTAEYIKTLTGLRDEMIVAQEEYRKAIEGAKNMITTLHNELDVQKARAESFRLASVGFERAAETYKEKLELHKKSKWYHLLFGIKPKH